LLTLEVLEQVVRNDSLQARYQVLTSDQLHGRGMAPILTLLKLLIARLTPDQNVGDTAGLPSYTPSLHLKYL